MTAAPSEARTRTTTAALEPAHALPIGEVMARLDTNPDGLHPDEVARRRQRYGPNIVPRAGGDSALRIFLRQINNPLVFVLLGSAGLALAFGKLTDGIVVLAVVVLNSLVGFMQEYRAGRAIEALIEMVPQTATALRDGTRMALPAAELVPGDIVVVQSGDRVPADLRLFQVRSLQIDEAALTGESVPVSKREAPVEAGAALGDRICMAFGGTLVTYGAGLGVVVATGAATELGRVSALLRTTTHVETPLTRQLARVGRLLTAGILAVSAALLLVGLWRGYPPVDAVLAAITLAVAAIPEGLPAIITIALAIGVQRMARRRAVVRRLPAVETLGSTTVICSDKTGTLTRNEMTVQRIWTPASGLVEITGVGYAPNGRLERDGRPVAPDDALAELLRAGILCNDAALESAAGRWTVAGDPTEGALLVAAAKAGFDPASVRAAWPRLDALPFESERQWMATVHRSPDGNAILYVKGAPEVVLAACNRCPDSAGAPHPADLLELVDELAEDGLRILAFARRTLPADHGPLDPNGATAGLTLLGLQAMIDPPRPEAIDAVRRCHRAGIKVKMITGDHPGTAVAIGRNLGLLAPGETAVTGASLATMRPDEIEASVEQASVFARVAPEHKLQLVQALQARGAVVAMTGDGVNDAPALKQANIGVAMGITGTAVSKEAADIVLTDDNFASITAAVEEGRRVYDNLVKALAFVLPTNLGEALIILLAVLAFPIVDGQPLLPMSPVQILWINLVATVTLALPLAFEAPERTVMQRPPRAPNAPILSRFVIQRTILVAALMTAGAIGLFLWEYFVETARGVAPALALSEAQTMAVTAVILFQVFYLLNCRSLTSSAFSVGLWSNPSIYVGIAAIVGLQAAFIYLAPMNALFGSAPLKPFDLGVAALVALVVYPVVGFEKWLHRRRPNG